MGPSSTAGPPGSARSSRRAFPPVLLLFTANGLQAGTYTLLVADLARALRLGEGRLGVALAALSAGAAAGVLLFGRLADRWGRRPVLVLGCAGAGSFYLALGQVRAYPVLVVAMAVGGLLLSAFDLSPTTIGGDYERQRGTPSMSLFFASQDGGVAVGAASSGLALAAGVGYAVVYGTLGVLLLVLAAAALILPLPAAAAGDAVAPGNPDREQPAAATPHGVRNGVVLAATFVALISLIDAAMEGYSSLYLRETLGSGPALAGLAIAVSALALGAGRVTVAALLPRTGERQLMLASGAAAAAAVLLIVATGLPAVAAAGLLLLRFWQAPVVPVGYSLAARSRPDRAGQATSVAWASLYLAFLAGPLIAGGLAEWVGLRAALGSFAIAAAAIAVLAVTLARPLLRGPPARERTS